MKKQFKGLLVISLIIVLGACSKQEKPMQREVSKDINTELVKKVTGAWLGEDEKEKKIYDITYKKQTLWINQEELEVTETKDNLVTLAIILGGTSLGLNGIWWALSSTSIVKGVLFVIVFQWVIRTKKQVAA